MRRTLRATCRACATKSTRKCGRSAQSGTDTIARVPVPEHRVTIAAMTDPDRTRDTATGGGDTQDRHEDSRAEPGAVLVLGPRGATRIAMRIGKDGIVIGRSSFGGAVEEYDRASRSHVRVTRSAGAFVVEDAGSRNGTRVRGEEIDGARVLAAGDVIRFGRSIVLLVDDVRPFEIARPAIEGDVVIGPTLRAAHAAITLAAAEHDTLFLRGESGTGKEIAARLFHDASARTGALVAVNCAAIPVGLAERLLFGARRGAYSGAEDAEGYVQSANNGTLFLDEIAELDAAVQSKLLRVLESREVLALGASKPRVVDVRFVFATHKDLREEAQRGTFRKDLLYRIARPEVHLPTLAERREDIPWLVERALAKAPHVSLVEACMLRAWPGNVRELIAEVKQAALRARATSRDEVTARDLSDDAGHALDTKKSDAPKPDDERIARTLAEEGGNVTRAAKALGIHRTQLRRIIDKQKK